MTVYILEQWNLFKVNTILCFSCYFDQIPFVFLGFIIEAVCKTQTAYKLE